MLGIQTLISAGFGTVFTYVCVGVAVVAIAYVLYKAYANHRRRRTPTEFEDNSRDRQQRQQRIADHADNALELKQDAQQILTQVRDQQQHFGVILTDFDRMIVNIQSTNSGVDQANHTLQDKVIDSLISLLEKMKTEYQQMSTLLSTLSSALDHTNLTFAAREKEINQVVSNLQAIETSANQSIQRVASEWPAIRHIQNTLCRKIEQITELQKKNQTLKQCLKDSAATNAQLYERVADLSELNERQRSLLDMLDLAGNQAHSSENRRRTLPPGFKLFETPRIPSDRSPTELTPAGFNHVTIRKRK